MHHQRFVFPIIVVVLFNILWSIKCGHAKENKECTFVAELPSEMNCTCTNAPAKYQFGNAYITRFETHLTCFIRSTHDIDSIVNAVRKKHVVLDGLVLKGTDNVIDYLPLMFCRQLGAKSIILDNLVMESLAADFDASGPFKSCVLEHFGVSHTFVLDSSWKTLSRPTSIIYALSVSHYDVFPLKRMFDVAPISTKIVTLTNVQNAGSYINSGSSNAVVNMEELSLIDSPMPTFAPKAMPFFLRSLSLQNNSLTSINAESFKLMGYLTKIEIIDNLLETLEESVFGSFTGTLIVKGNPLKCDKSLEWLKTRLTAGDIDGEVICDNGKNLLDVTL